VHKTNLLSDIINRSRGGVKLKEYEKINSIILLY
jgi:hypothetical protein